jgi:uroporphyrinogen-III synthase
MKKIYLFSATPNKNALHVNTLDFDFFQPQIDFSKYDFLILTSKKAVDALRYYKKEDYIDIPALCISKFTKEYYEKFGGKILEVGNGLGSDLKKIIQKYPDDKKWLYLRAKKIATDGFGTDEVILYESRCSDEILNFKLSDDEATLIFTSPSSVECFLKNNSFKNTHKVIVIGSTTAKALSPNINYKTPLKTSIKSCLDLAAHF